MVGVEEGVLAAGWKVAVGPIACLELRHIAALCGAMCLSAIEKAPLQRQMRGFRFGEWRCLALDEVGGLLAAGHMAVGLIVELVLRLLEG